ncbi:MAG: Hsp70 family protein, partial [bacterium]|nr:Hsp70 family protein [bacterium]
KDLGTGREQAMTITGGTALSPDEIERMVEDAERYAEEDAKRRELADTRNQAEQVVNQTEKLLEEHGDQLDEDERAGIDSALSDLRSAAEDESATAEDIQSKIEDTFRASQVLAQKMYASQASEHAEAGAGPGGDMDDAEDIVEAEIIEDEEDR